MAQLISGGMIQQFLCSKTNFDVQQAIFAIENGVQKQHVGKECGIANTTSVAFGKDPSEMSYKELVLHEHFFNCFSKETLEVFPTA